MQKGFLEMNFVREEIVDPDAEDVARAMARASLEQAAKEMTGTGRASVKTSWLLPTEEDSRTGYLCVGTARYSVHIQHPVSEGGPMRLDACEKFHKVVVENHQDALRQRLQRNSKDIIICDAYL